MKEKSEQVVSDSYSSNSDFWSNDHCVQYVQLAQPRRAYRPVTTEDEITVTLTIHDRFNPTAPRAALRCAAQTRPHLCHAW
jgi:hypothetical protein